MITHTVCFLSLLAYNLLIHRKRFYLPVNLCIRYDSDRNWSHHSRNRVFAAIQLWSISFQFTFIAFVFVVYQLNFLLSSSSSSSSFDFSFHWRAWPCSSLYSTNLFPLSLLSNSQFRSSRHSRASYFFRSHLDLFSLFCLIRPYSCVAALVTQSPSSVLTYFAANRLSIPFRPENHSFRPLWSAKDGSALTWFNQCTVSCFQLNSFLHYHPANVLIGR